MRKNPAVLLLITVFFWYSLYVHIPFQTPYLTGIGVVSGTVGFIVGCYGLTQTLARIPFGFFADSRGRFKPFWVFGSLFGLISCLTRFFFPNAAGLLIGNLFSGMGAATWNQYIVCYTGIFPKEKLQKATGQIIAANNLGILGGFVGGMLLYDRFGMRVICLSGAVFALLALLLALYTDNPGAKEPAALHREDLKALLTNKRILLFGFTLLIQQGLVSATANGFSSQVARDLGANGVQLGLCSIFYILSAVLFSNLNGGKLHRKLGSYKVIGGIFLLLVIYCVIVPNMTSVWGVIAANILAGISQGWMVAAATAEGLKGIPDRVRASSMGVFGTIYGIGMMTFPMITGGINEHFGICAAFYTLAGICLIAGVFMFCLGHKNDQ